VKRVENKMLSSLGRPTLGALSRRVWLNSFISVESRGTMHPCGLSWRSSSTDDFAGDWNDDLDLLAETSTKSQRKGSLAKDVYPSIWSSYYEDVSSSDVSKFLSEGLPSGLKTEFDFTNNTKWMNREVGRKLCGLIDLYTRNKGNGSSDNIARDTGVEGIGNEELLGLTDRAEWPDAILSVSTYGKRLEIDSDIMNLPENCKILLSGPRGCGKSVALAQTVMHARRSGWLCVYVPHGWAQTQDGPYVEPLPRSWRSCLLSPEEDARGDRLFNNPVMSAGILRDTFQAHQTDLNELPITNEIFKSTLQKSVESLKETWNRAMITVSDKKVVNFIQKRQRYEGDDSISTEDEKDDTLLNDFDWDHFKLETLGDLCLLGVAFRDISGFCVTVLIEELRSLDIQDKPVLLAVDEYNCLIGPSAFFYNDIPVVSQEMCVPRALSFLSKNRNDTHSWTLKNGLCMAAVSHKYPEGKHTTFQDAMRSVPLIINVPRYSQREYMAALQYYMHCGSIDENVESQRVLAFRTYTGSTPAQVRQGTGAYFNRDALDEVADPRGRDYGANAAYIDKLNLKNFAAGSNEVDDNVSEGY
jgi:hypothetical protein